MLTVNECTALYAGGPFGEIAEVYITPDSRSAVIGGRLVDAAACLTVYGGRGSCAAPLETDRCVLSSPRVPGYRAAIGIGIVNHGGI